MDVNQNAPNPTTAKDHTHHQEINSKLTRTVKEQVNQAIAELKRTSEAKNNKESKEGNNSEVLPKKRQKTIVVGEIETSFEIPEEYASHGTELDKLPVLPPLEERIKPGHVRNVRHKFFERLKDWKLQSRQRADGRLDTYFHHNKSNELFRSNIEVVNFILYEVCPHHLQRATKAPNEKLLGLNEDGGLPKSDHTSSCSPGSGKSEQENCTTRIIGADKKTVGEFLEMAYNNMMNNHVNKSTSESFLTHDDKPMSYGRVSSAAKDDSFELENTYGTKRKKTEASSSGTLRIVEKCLAPSPDTVTAPSVDVVSNVNVEVQEMVSVPELNAIIEPVNPTANVTDGESDVDIANLDRFDDIFHELEQLLDLPEPSYNPYEYGLATSEDKLK